MNTLNNTLNTQTINLVLVNLASTLVRTESCTPKQAMATAVSFTENLERLLGTGSRWADKFEDTLDNCEVDGIIPDAYEVILALEDIEYIYAFGATYIAGSELIKILDTDKTSYAPLLASEGITDRKRNYATIEVSKLFTEAVHALEETPFMRSDFMMKIASDVFSVSEDPKLLAQQYVIDGTAAMSSGVAYVSEYFGDKRGRLYQACCFGPNGQSSDLARSLMDLHDVSTNYDIATAKAILLEEMEDMGTWNDMKAFKTDYLAAINNPVQFILTNLDKSNNVTKCWNFVKFAKLIQAIGKFEKGEGNKPYIGVAVGYDAKCSGPQLGALMVADENMLVACGFSMTQVDDAYHNAIAKCEEAGISGLSRSLVKKTFMAIFYGASQGAMLDADTITQETYDVLYANLSIEEMEGKAELYYKAVNASFGAKLNNLRRKFKEAGIIYGNDQQLPKYDKRVKHMMPDGLEVAMKYNKKVSIEGTLVAHKEEVVFTKIETNDQVRYFKGLSFNTNDVDLVAYARNGFVNMIQATDGLLARMIVVNLKRSGVKHIVSIHDCFRVNINDTVKLQEAIKLAYLELFGSSHNIKTDDMILGTDIIGLYFQGSLEATHDDYRTEASKGSQFYGKNSVRRLDDIGTQTFVSLVESLDVTAENGTYYFAK